MFNKCVSLGLLLILSIGLLVSYICSERNIREIRLNKEAVIEGTTVQRDTLEMIKLNQKNIEALREKLSPVIEPLQLQPATQTFAK